MKTLLLTFCLVILSSSPFIEMPTYDIEFLDDYELVTRADGLTRRDIRAMEFYFSCYEDLLELVNDKMIPQFDNLQNAYAISRQEVAILKSQLTTTRTVAISASAVAVIETFILIFGD